MADFDLDAITARAEAATPGPWEFQHWGGQNQNGDYAESILFDGSGETLTYGLPDADGEFIAHAREDVPRLIAALEEAWVVALSERSLAAREAQERRDHQARTERLTAALAEMTEYRDGAWGDLHRAQAERDEARATLRKIADAVASGDDVSRTVRAILTGVGLYGTDVPTPVEQTQDERWEAEAERLHAEETPEETSEDEQAAAAMRMALLESLIEALGGDYDDMNAVAKVPSALRDRRDAQTAMRMILGLFGARVYGRALLFHQVAKTPLWGHAEALTSTGALREAGLTTADLGWPADVLHDFYAADAAEWEPQDRARFDAAVQAWRDAHPDGAL